MDSNCSAGITYGEYCGDGGGDCCGLGGLGDGGGDSCFGGLGDGGRGFGDCRGFGDNCGGFGDNCGGFGDNCGGFGDGGGGFGDDVGGFGDDSGRVRRVALIVDTGEGDGLISRFCGVGVGVGRGDNATALGATAGTIVDEGLTNDIYILYNDLMILNHSC